MKITAEQLNAATGCGPERAAIWQPLLDEAFACYGLDEPLVIAAFLAQAAHESSCFSRLEENLNYSATALRSVWPSRFGELEAHAFARKPEAIANRAYGGRMGNGPEATGDGWLFRGGGLFQLTGRANYRACGKALGIDLEAKPDVIRQADWPAAHSAAWYWTSRGLSDWVGDFKELTRRINGGHMGLAHRQELFARTKKALEV